MEIEPGNEPGNEPGTEAGNWGLLYDAEYYRQHCGPVPYGRAPAWMQFFGNAAEVLIRVLNPRRVFDAGCAWGLLVEAFRDRRVEAWGVDLSSYAIGNVRTDIQPYCRVASLTETIPGFYDLIACIEVLEHMPEHDANQAIFNLCRATDTILFSSTPSDLSEPTHVNVRPIVSWLQLFARQGFMPDVLFDASFVSPHAFLVRRGAKRLAPEAIELFSEKLRVQAELVRNREKLAQVEREFQDVVASPGWRLIQRYRDWMSARRARHPRTFRLVDRLVLSAGNRAAGRSAAPASSEPEAQPASPLPPPDDGAASRAAPPAVDTEAASTYADWILQQEPDAAGLAAQRALAANFSHQPKISIVVPVYRVPLEILKETIASVAAQTYGNWELCLAHADPAASETREYIGWLAQADARIKVLLLEENRGISGNSNQAFSLATGEFIGLLDHDDALAPFALFEVAQVLNRYPSVDFLYSDRDEISHRGGVPQRVNPLLKPQWSPEILLSANYLTHFCVLSAELVRGIGGWREEMDGAQDWDLFLRAIQRARTVYHIPQILYHWRQIGTSVAGAGLAAKPYAEQAQVHALQEHCRRQSWSADAAFDVNRRLRILWKPSAEQTISVILISDAPAAEALAQARSLQSGCTHPPTEIVVPLTSDLVSENPGIHAVRVPEAASLAEKISRAVEHSTGEILVFLDQALSPAGGDWLSELVGPLQNREIGMVGGMMLKPGTAEVRHAGLVFTEGNRLEYIFAGEPEDIDAEFGGPTWYRDWSAVSGACFSLRREVWNATGGFSGALQYPRLDVDLCLKVRFQAGLRVLYNPFARFYQSKPAALEGWLWRVSQEATGAFLDRCFPSGDPYFHGKLTCREGRVRLLDRAAFAESGSAWRGRAGQS